MNKTLWVILCAGILLPCTLRAAPASLDVEAVATQARISEPRMDAAGDAIVYVLSRPGDHEKAARSELMWIAAEGSEPRQLTRNPGPDWHPRWHPEGERLAFLSKRGEKAESQIYLMDMQGGEARQLSHASAPVLDFAWSPDGEKLAYVARQDESAVCRRETHQARVRTES